MTKKHLDEQSGLDSRVDHWVDYFYNRGISLELINEYKVFIRHLMSKDLPIIFELEHLSELIGIKYPEFLKIINNPDEYYRHFEIKKRKGGKREILAPLPSLLHCQRWVYKEILTKSVVHDNAHGFITNRSIITNASLHLNKKCILKMDIKDFFPSIPINWVINYFSSLGYPNNVSYYLSAICCCDNVLPQGAATSPYLSNILLLSLDDRLTRLSKKYNLVYSRYADDMNFSGEYIPSNFSKIVSEIISSYGLEANSGKTQLLTKRGKRIITGLSVSGDTLTIPRNKKREIRKELHYIEKFGYLSHAAKLKIKNPAYIDSLEGKLTFWLQVEPDNAFAKSGLLLIRNIRK